MYHGRFYFFTIFFSKEITLENHSFAFLDTCEKHVSDENILQRKTIHHFISAHWPLAKEAGHPIQEY